MSVKVVIKLTKARPFNGVIRDPGAVLLEGIIPEGLTADKVFNALSQGAAEIEVIQTKKEKRKDDLKESNKE